MTHEEAAALLAENAALLAEVATLRTENTELRRLLGELAAQIEPLTERLSDLEKKSRVPSFVKANRPKKEKVDKPRRKRAAKHNQARRREEPTRIEEHAVDECKTCGYHLSGDSESYRRQVIELPEPSPVEVIEHRILKRHCPTCETMQYPDIDWSRKVIGQGRIGIRLAALIAYLRQSMRQPVRSIQQYLQTVHQVRLSIGEITQLLNRMAEQVQPAVEALQQAIRQEPVVHADETGWRENGQNGYIWCMASTGKNPIRYYEYHRSRAGQVVVDLLGDSFAGHLVSDFYGAYNIYPGPHQRCWVHLLRDLRTMKEEHQDDGELLAWILAIRLQFDEALRVDPQTGPDERRRLYDGFRRRTELLGLQYAQAKGHACRAMAQRLLRHLDELYQFVLNPNVSADNNAAERAIRPLVVQRKISGGSRSRKGSDTRMKLASLFETWQARQQNPFHEFLNLLMHPSALSP